MTDQPEPDDLAATLRALRASEDEAMRMSWDRSLPLGDELFDRWERARELGFGSDASIYHSAYVYGDVSVGAGTWVGPMALLDGSGGLTIGSGCSISAGVQIYTHSTVRWAVSGGATEYERAPTRIGDNTFVGPLSVVAMGVTIGSRCIIGAHAFVNRDVPDGCVAVGVPARVTGRVEVHDDGTVRTTYGEPGLP
jgi:carbonic anhydrase/acetyltransferase-like protein (isoleucine patch superfamily)